MVGIAAAGSEIGINVANAYRGVSDIGRGMMLGSNIVSILLIVTMAYFASRTADLGPDRSDDADGEGSVERDGGTDSHKRHRRENVLRIQRDAVRVLIGPYLGILALVALLTIPAPVRGLQSTDGLIMVGA